MKRRPSFPLGKLLVEMALEAAHLVVSKHEREVARECVTVRALAGDRDAIGLIHKLDSDLRGRSESSIVRAHAANRLGRLRDPRAIPFLMEMRHDPEEQVRFTVITALGRLKAKEAQGFLLDTLKDPSPLLRASAAEALGEIGEVDAIPELRDVLDSDPDPYVRLHAVESLVILGDKPSRDRVPELLSAVGPRTRKDPRFKLLREAAESGQELTPWWVTSWESDPGW